MVAELFTILISTKVIVLGFVHFFFVRAWSATHLVSSAQYRSAPFRLDGSNQYLLVFVFASATSALHVYIIQQL